MKKRVLFLLSDTGGGHRASAQAICEGLAHLYPGRYETIIEDVWKSQTPRPISAMPNSYGWLTGPGVPIWRLLWTLSSPPRVLKLGFAAVAPLIKPRMTAYLTAVQPDMVVSVHPLMNHLGMACLDATGLEVPFITVVTDMVTFHPGWICPSVTHCIVPTELARDRALTLGMPPEKLTVHGQPVSLRFSSPRADKRTVRRHLGLDTDRYTILLTGGGEGAGSGQLRRIARRLDRTVPDAQLLVVTGRNHLLQRQLTDRRWRMPTHVFGFVDNMPELMAAADILITKAGPGSISEAFIAGLPPVISSYIPGQETGNVAYVQANGAGAYKRRPRDIAELVLRWMTTERSAADRLAANAARLARPEAALSIAAELCRFI